MADEYLRVLTVEVSRLSDNKDEHWRQFRELEGLMRQVQEVQNAFFDLWRAWHFERGSAARIRAYHAAWKAYQELPMERKYLMKAVKNQSPKVDKLKEFVIVTVEDAAKLQAAIKSGDKVKFPKFKWYPMPPELQKHIYRFVVTNWPDLHTRVVALTLNRLQQLVGSTKSAKGNWPGWHSWLLFRQQIPVFTSPCPLAIDKANCYLEAPKMVDAGACCDSPKKVDAGNKPTKRVVDAGSTGHHTLHCVLSREDQPGKKMMKGVTYHLSIWDKGRKMLSRRQMLARIAAGDVTFCGSQLFIKDGKLFAALAYKLPKPALIAGEGTAIVYPMPNRPFGMRAEGRTWRIGGDGRVIGVVRRQLMGQRWSRQQTYRTSATSARKGHGRKRAMDKVFILSNRWRNFVKTYNRNMAIEICRRAVAMKCGVVVLSKRCDESRWLSRAGKFDRRDKSGWDWFGLEKALRDKAVEWGLVVELHEPTKREADVPQVVVVT